MNVAPDDVTHWTLAAVEKVLDDALNGDAASRHVVSVWMSYKLTAPIRTILSHLGEDADLTGGTMGEPHTAPELAFVLYEVFEDTVLKGFGYYVDPCQPTLSEEELRRACFIDFLWNAVNYTD